MVLGGLEAESYLPFRVYSEYRHLVAIAAESTLDHAA
jgi:hypothetical protein